MVWGQFGATRTICRRDWRRTKEGKVYSRYPDILYWFFLYPTWGWGCWYFRAGPTASRGCCWFWGASVYPHFLGWGSKYILDYNGWLTTYIDDVDGCVYLLAQFLTTIKILHGRGLRYLLSPLKSKTPSWEWGNKVCRTQLPMAYHLPDCLHCKGEYRSLLQETPCVKYMLPPKGCLTPSLIIDIGTGDDKASQDSSIPY